MKRLADIYYKESIETVILKELEQNIDFIEKIFPFSPGDVSLKKAKLKSSFRVPLSNWTMPAQPEGYIRAGKYDLL